MKKYLQADAVQQRQRLFPGILPGTFLGLHRSQQDIIQHGQVREQFVILEYHSDFAAHLWQVFAALPDQFTPEPDFSALNRFQGVNTSQ